MEEAGVEEMEDGVFDATDVLVHREPIVGLFIEHGPILIRAGIAGIIPGGFHEGVEGVGFPLGLAAADGAIDFIKCRFAFEGRGSVVEPNVLGEEHGEVLVGDRHGPAIGTIDHGDGRAPVSLPRDAPVPEPKVGLALAFAMVFEPLSDTVEGLFGIETGKFPGVSEDALFHEGGLFEIPLLAVGGEYHRNDGKTVFRLMN